jgi:ERCC4-type nuclease
MSKIQKIILRIDNRETDLISVLRKKEEEKENNQIEIIVENLPIGDVILCDGTKYVTKEEGEKERELLIIERKSISDLASSITDGRYEEQSYRLSGLSHPNHNILYLVEGNIPLQQTAFKNSRVSPQAIFSAIFSLNYYKGFSVIRTMNMDETATFIWNACNKLIKESEKGREPYFGCKNKEKDKEKENPIQEGGEERKVNTEYSSVVKKVKKENVTPENIGEIILCQIPSISSVTAIAIMKKFGCSFPDFMKAIQEDDTCLEGITYTNSNGKTRKINKSAVSSIKRYLSSLK